MHMNIFDDPSLLMEYYKTQTDEFRMRHQAIWEEIKHYSWLLSLLLGWPTLLFLNGDSSKVEAPSPYLVVLPILGLLFSVIAFFVIRREYHFYNAVEARLLYMENLLGLSSRPDFLDPRLEKTRSQKFSVKQHIEDVKPIGTFMPWKARIRALFLGGFLVFALIAVGEIIYCVSGLV
jgi:hypothetical protein